ncbi:MAG: hypothetical protein RR777_02170 [Christensenellaceae bacterium]
MKIEIPLKLPSLNEYIAFCRYNKYSANKEKQSVQNDIAIFLKKLPKLKTPIKINFTWVEKDKRRDLDNVAFAKKYILDCLVKLEKIEDDGQKYVIGFTDSFKYDKENKVILEIIEC